MPSTVLSERDGQRRDDEGAEEFELVEPLKAGSQDSGPIAAGKTPGGLMPTPPSQNWSEAGPAVSAARPSPDAPTVALTRKLEQLAQRIKAAERRDNEQSTMCPECVELQRRLDGIRRQLPASRRRSFSSSRSKPIGSPAT